MTVDTSAEAVERLAELLDSIRLAGTQECCWEAAATLRALAAERDALRAECDTLQAERDVACDRHLAAEADRDAARAEVARLREALTTLRRAITDEDEHNNCSIIDTVWVSSVETAVDFIDAALAGDPQP